MSDPYADLSSSQIQELIEFCVSVSLRTPEFVDLARKDALSYDFVKRLLETEEVGTNSFKKALDHIEDIRNKQGLMFASTFNHVFRHRFDRMIEHFDFCLAVSNETDCCFVVGDNYVSMECVDHNLLEYHIKSGIREWWNLDVHCYFPISSNMCLTAVPANDISMKGTRSVWWQGVKKVGQDYIEHINSLSLNQTSRFLYSGSEKTLKQLKKNNK